MLRFQNLRWIIAVIGTILLLAMPVSAQGSPSGLNVEVSEAGVSIYRVNADGSQSLIIFVPATGDGVATTAPPANNFSTASDVVRDGFLIVNTSALNVRSGPSTDYTIITTVPGGTQLGVVGRSRNEATENWWFVDLNNGVRGWVNNIHVLIRGDLSAAETVATVGGSIIQPTLYIGYPGNLIFPSLPHQGIAICSLPGRVEFPILGRSQQSNWYQIAGTCQDGRTVIGWIQAELGIVRNPAGVEFPVTDNN